MALTDKLTAIADAIRGKTGKADEMTLDQMAVEIAGISGGSGGSIDWEFINSVELAEEVSGSTVEITTDYKGNPFAYKELLIVVNAQAPSGQSAQFEWIPNSSWSTGESTTSFTKVPDSYMDMTTAQAVIVDIADGSHFVHQHEVYKPYAIAGASKPIQFIKSDAKWSAFTKYKWKGSFAVGSQFILFGRNKV